MSSTPSTPPTPPDRTPTGSFSRITSRLRTISGAFPIFKETFDWKWVLVGGGIIVGGNIVALVLLHSIIQHLFIEQGHVLAGAALMASVALSIYFVGGVVVGRMSSGRTVKEPAVAAVLSLLILFVLQLFLGMLNILGLILGAPLCFGLAYLGGYVGEKWQEKIERTSR